MADGCLNFDTEVNEKGFNEGVSKISRIATTGLGVAVGNTITKVVGKIGELGTASIKVGMAFEAEMSKVSAISGATGDELQALTDKAKEMGAKTKFSATESAQAMEYMAMAGWKTADMLNGIEGIMNLAAASGESLAATSDIVTDALTAFGLSAQDSTHFADVLAAASSNANTNVSMLGETFKYVAPVAGALGFSVEDCGVAIGLMANSGIKAGQAGTSLRQMLSRLTKPTKEVQTAMDQLGFSLTDSEGNVKSLDTVMGDLRNGFKGLSRAEQTQIATSLAGQEAMSGLLAIVNASDEDFNKLKDSIYNADGAAAEMAATMQDNLTGQLTILKSEAEGLGIEIYESIEVPLKNMAAAGVDALSKLSEAYSSGGFTGFLDELGNEIGTQVDQMIATMQTKGPEVITNFCNGITAALPNLIAQGATMLNNLMQAITANLPAIIQGGIAIVSTLITGIAQQLPTLIPTALMMIVTLVGSLLSNVGQLVDAGVNLLIGLAQGVVNALPQLINKAPTIIGQLATAIISNLPKILMAGIKIITILGTGLIQAVPQLIGKIPSIISQIKNAFTSVDWGSVGHNIIKGIANGLSSAAGAIVDAAKSAASKALESAKDFLGINSPSRVFRDQVGKMMALGMGIGFEQNIPIKSMSDGVQRAVSGLQKSVDVALSARTSDKTVGGVKESPGFNGDKDIDYDRLEKIQMKAAAKMAKRPIYLGTKRIDEPLPEGAVPVW